MINAYKGGNIGMISNNITKVWNSKHINLDVVKLLCMENNFTIDYAKTLYKPVRPKEKNKLLQEYTRKKVPHFFIYAKDKEFDKVERRNNSVVNRLHKIIPNPMINFKAVGLNNFDYKMLMDDSNVDMNNVIAKLIIEKYEELDLKKRFLPIVNENEDSRLILYMYVDIRNQLLSVWNNINYVVDVLVKFLYKSKKSSYKTTLWASFGDVLVKNLRYNISMNQTYCEICGDLVTMTGFNQKYCDECATDVIRENNRKRFKKWYDNQKV